MTLDPIKDKLTKVFTYVAMTCIVSTLISIFTLVAVIGFGIKLVFAK